MRFWSFVIVLLCSLTVAYGQQKTPAIRQLERQRKNALAEIEMTNKLLEQTKANTQISLNRLNLISQQILSRQKVISLLTQEMNQIDMQMQDKQKEIEFLQLELQKKKDAYAKAMRGVYRRHSAQDKLLFILSAKNFAQSLRRIRYLQEYSDWQKRQAEEIVMKEDEITSQKKNLLLIRNDKQVLLGSREAEHQKLQVEQTNKKQEVQQLNMKQKDLKAQLAKKRRQAQALNSRIEELIAEEVRRAEAEAQAAREKAERERIARELASAKTGKSNAKENAKVKSVQPERIAETKGGYAMTQAERTLSANFSDNRGRLPYPVTGSHTIVATFGEQQHEDLQYVRTVNSGIDIQTSPGADARAVFTGVVTRVFVVPGYNNSVIVRHGNYLTVYSNLSSVYVKAGDRVSTRQPLGRIFSDPEDHNATILTFQLWKERTKLNPAPWLE